MVVSVIAYVLRWDFFHDHCMQLWLDWKIRAPDTTVIDYVLLTKFMTCVVPWSCIGPQAHGKFWAKNIRPQVIWWLTRVHSRAYLGTSLGHSSPQLFNRFICSRWALGRWLTARSAIHPACVHIGRYRHASSRSSRSIFIERKHSAVLCLCSFCYYIQLSIREITNKWINVRRWRV